MSNGRTLTPEEKLKVDLTNLLMIAKTMLNTKEKTALTDKLLLTLRSFISNKASDEAKTAAIRQLIVSDKNNLYLIEFTFANLAAHYSTDPLTKKNIVEPFIQNIQTLKAEIAEKRAALTITKGKSTISATDNKSMLKTALHDYITDSDPNHRIKHLANIAQRISALSEINERGIHAKLTASAELEIQAIIKDPLLGERYRTALKEAYQQADFLGAEPAILKPVLASHRPNLFTRKEDKDRAPATREDKEFDKKTSLGPGLKK